MKEVHCNILDAFILDIRSAILATLGKDMIKDQHIAIQLQIAKQEIQDLRLQIRHLRLQIRAMETSKFWKLRTSYLMIKARILDTAKRFLRGSSNTENNQEIFQTQGQVQVNYPYNSDVKPQRRHNDFGLAKEIFTKYSAVAFNALTDSPTKLVLPTSEEPIVSIILVLYNRAELTYMCLRSLCEYRGTQPMEVIIIDNASSDETRLLLEKVEGAHIVLNPENRFFSPAVNQAARLAKGKYLLLLNNDAQLLPGSLSSAIATIESADDIGVVGGRIILLDGSLQEAGSLIWSDGSCLGYGRGDNPSAPMYMFQRDVDYCSGALFLTSKDLFLEMNGFDEAYSPAYYEETDYCVKLLKAGKRIVYDPNAVILHYEFASSTSSLNAIELQKAHRDLFVAKHSDWLEAQYPSGQSNVLPARTRQSSGQKRILFIEDYAPHTWMGSGLPRSNVILSYLAELGYFVTCYPMFASVHDTWNYVYSDIAKTVEVMIGPEYRKSGLRDFLQQRQGYYDYLLVSRPHNMKAVRSAFEDMPSELSRYKLIYDAEAIFANRDILKLSLQGNAPSEIEAQDLIHKELQLAQGAEAVITVSNLERRQFLNDGYPNVHVLGFAFDSHVSETPFENRRDFLFVGAMPEGDNPNTDSVIWFVNKVMPIINQKEGAKIRLLLAGTTRSREILELSSEQVILLDNVDDLTFLYSTTRVFVAPTRFAAGISHKVCEAAAKGIPVVTTSLIAKQLGWQSGTELLTADTPETFADCCLQLYRSREDWEMIRSNALEAVQREHSHAKFVERLKEILSSVQVD